MEILPKGKEITSEKLKGIDFQNINSSNWTTDEKTNILVQELINNYCLTFKVAEAECKRQMDKIKVGDELPNGVMQLAKVYIAKKRKITVGDKMAGRHGNKGIGPRSSVRKTCRSLRTELLWTLSSTLSACLHV